MPMSTAYLTGTDQMKNVLEQDHDYVIKWKHFPRFWPFACGKFTGQNTPHKSQWLGAFLFSLICAWTNGWVNNRDAGDLRHYRTHYDVNVDVNVIIYIIISQNIRYLLWNRGARRFFHDTYLTIKVQGIRCTNHLHDSCPLTDVNPHFTVPGCRYYFKINSWWPIVTSSTHGPAASYCDVTMIHCSHGYLWTHDVEVDAS